MDLDILHPGKAVESAFEAPNLVLALVIVLLAPVASVGGRFLYSLPVTAEGAIYTVAFAYVSFFLLAIVAFVLAMLFNAKAAKGKFMGLFSALALTRIVALVVEIFSIATIPLYVSPKAMAVIVEVSSSPNLQLMVNKLNDLIASSPDAINVGVFSILLAIGFAIMLFGAYIAYLAVRKLASSSRWAAIGLTAIAFIIVGALPI